MLLEIVAVPQRRVLRWIIFHLHSISIKMEIKFIKVFVWFGVFFFSNSLPPNDFECMIPFKGPAPSHKSSPCLCSTFQTSSCMSSFCTDTNFCLLSHDNSTMWGSFAEAFHRVVQNTNLPLIQRETLSYNSNLMENFYLAVYFPSVTQYILVWCVFSLLRMCNRHTLDLTGRVFTEQWCRQKSKEESCVDPN